MDIQNIALTGGAVYGGLQVLAQGVMAIHAALAAATNSPNYKGTILWRLCKFIVAGGARDSQAS